MRECMCVTSYCSRKWSIIITWLDLRSVKMPVGSLAVQLNYTAFVAGMSEESLGVAIHMMVCSSLKQPMGE